MVLAGYMDMQSWPIMPIIYSPLPGIKDQAQRLANGPNYNPSEKDMRGLNMANQHEPS